MSYSRNIKRNKIKDALQQKITSAQYAFGERLPGIHDLSKEYSVSYVTAGKALKILESEGYLRCQHGVGNFVCYIKPAPAVCKIVNFIAPDSNHYVARYLFHEGKALFEQSGWEVRLLEIGDASLASVISEINSPDAYSVISGVRPIWENFTATLGHVANRAVVLGELSGNNDITSIIADEPATVRMCLNHFKQRGRRNIALVCTELNNDLELFRAAAWRSGMTKLKHDFNWINRHCFNFKLKEHGIDYNYIRGSIRKWLENRLNGADAVILPAFAPLFLEECRNLSIRIPDDLDVIAIGRGAADLQADICYVDNNIQAHIRYAFEILENRFAGGPHDQGSWYFCPPNGIINPSINKPSNSRSTP